MTAQAADPIPLEDAFDFRGPDASGHCAAMFYAFNTVVSLQAFAEEAACCEAFQQALDACRRFERLFSRTLPHSDISRINDARGAWVDVSRETFDLLTASVRYCAESDGVFDITMGSAVRLWDFHRGIIADEAKLKTALRHVDWRGIEFDEAENECDGKTRYRIRLEDPDASVDVGGTAKGYIADAVGAVLLQAGVHSFIVNLGGNVLAHGAKPDGNPWKIGLQDPRETRESGKILGAVPLMDASAVTSGTYERSFEHNGTTYHHILDPETGFPVQTDIAGATVVARTSLDAEGYSTTLLALGKERAVRFVREHPSIMAAYLADDEGRVVAIEQPPQSA